MSKESGIAASPGKSFGAVATDVNNDGLTDLFVANDTMPNFLFVNQGAGQVRGGGAGGGRRLQRGGRAPLGDGRGRGRLRRRRLARPLRRQHRPGVLQPLPQPQDLTFTDEPGEIAPATQFLSGWGLKFFDYDNDGDSDLLLANGHPDDLIEMRTARRVKYSEPLLMFENTGKTFRNVSAQSGAVFARDLPARGLAVGDYDNDGDLDARALE